MSAIHMLNQFYSGFSMVNGGHWLGILFFQQAGFSLFASLIWLMTKVASLQLLSGNFFLVGERWHQMIFDYLSTMLLV